MDKINLESLVSLSDEVFTITDDTGVTVSVLLDSHAYNALQWFLHSQQEYCLSTQSGGWDLFVGPYIYKNETGYAIQVINRCSRKVYTLTIPFTAGVDADIVKAELVTSLSSSIR